MRKIRCDCAITIVNNIAQKIDLQAPLKTVRLYLKSSPPFSTMDSRAPSLRISYGVASNGMRGARA